MNKLRVICFVAVLASFICGLWFSIEPNTNVQLLSMLTVLILVFLLFISFVAGVYFVRRDKFHAFIPSVICLIGLFASVFVSSYLGVSIRDWKFQKNLPNYMEIVHRVEKGEIKTGSLLTEIDLPQQYLNLAIWTFGKTNSNGGAIIEFIIGSGFPVKHSGYLYVSSGKIEDDSTTLERWPHHSSISTNWFRVED